MRGGYLYGVDKEGVAHRLVEFRREGGIGRTHCGLELPVTSVGSASFPPVKEARRCRACPKAWKVFLGRG